MEKNFVHVCRILYVEEYVRLLQNTCSSSIDNSTRQLHVLSVVKCNVDSQNTASFTLKLNYKDWLY